MHKNILLMVWAGQLKVNQYMLVTKRRKNIDEELT
jgi:hypothetical protein